MSKLRKKPKSKRSTAIKKCDKAMSEYVRHRDTHFVGYDADGEPIRQGYCISCGKLTLYNDLDAGHFVGRRDYAVRWDLHNVNGQCRSCNRFRAQEVWPQYEKNLREKWGDEEVERIKADAGSYAGWTVDEIESMAAAFAASTEGIKRID